MKIYTRGGDDGSTGVLGGGRVPKDSTRVEAVGALDELNAALGWSAAAVPAELRDPLGRVQGELFEIGAHLAAAGPQAASSLPPLEEAMARRLEAEIDAAEGELPPLRQFILPAGAESSARLHLARAICRRAERAVVRLGHEAAVDARALVYLNRLSDWLFVQARLANRLAGVVDVPWRGR